MRTRGISPPTRQLTAVDDGDYEHVEASRRWCGSEEVHLCKRATCFHYTRLPFHWTPTEKRTNGSVPLRAYWLRLLLHAESATLSTRRCDHTLRGAPKRPRTPGGTGRCTLLHPPPFMMTNPRLHLRLLDSTV
nr:hypothetical protein CFP56_02700 [Quercus suber]